MKEVVTANGDVEPAALSPAQAETQAKIDELAATRKELVAGGFKDKHANWGSMILAFGITLAVEGGMNTYLRTGKLFPGPHLYAGMGMVHLGDGGGSGAGNAARQPEGARPSHRAQRREHRALHLADSHRSGDRR